MNIFILILYGLSLLTFILALLWILVPAYYGLPSKPTKPDRIRAALQTVNLQPDEVLYDLGAGDGRVLIIAAKEFDAKAIGLEVGPVQCLLIWLRIVRGGLSNRAKIKLANFYKTDLSDADVVFIYATSQELWKLASHLEEKMKPGSRLVSISADFPEWEPSVFDEKNLIFGYEMPPKEGSLTTYMLKNITE
ncbi:MAG TPA: hypothetical protein VLA72_20380 [Anaerolineales bacterium]|nr:hypothetical protein [Anaerolineales bacterium]